MGQGRKSRHSSRNTLKDVIDRAVYLIGIFGVIIYIPQLVKIWLEKSVTGLSLTSWIGIFIGSIIWLLYGIAHKQKPLVIINFLLAIIQFVIVVGIFYYNHWQIRW